MAITPKIHDYTLRDLRLKQGLDHAQVVEGMAAYLQQPPKSHRASVLYEFRGVRDVQLLRALGAVYGVSLEYIEQAAENTRAKKGHPRQKAGRRWGLVESK